MFDAGDFADGFARESVPTRLDAADLWQPHQVLWRSLTTLLGLSAGPRRLRAVDLNGPTGAAVAMGICGPAWTYLIVAAVTAVGAGVHSGCSPYIAAMCGLRVWGPRIMVASVVTPVLLMPVVLCAEYMGVSRPSRRQRLRFACYVVPVQTLYGALVISAAIAIEPEIGQSLVPVGILASFGPLWSAILRRDKAGSGLKVGHMLWVFAVAVVLTAVYLWGFVFWLPRDLEPPIWVYSY